MHLFYRVMPQRLLIKNMVCHRCVLSVENILKSSAIDYRNVNIGEVQLEQQLNEVQHRELQEKLKAIGLELIDNKLGATIEKIKQLVIKKARNETMPEEKGLKLSHYLSKQLHYEYTHLSSLFSLVEGRTIENFFIEQRIEKAKELLVYGQLSLSEIAHELDYSSVAHLSGQFKKITGLTPTHFRQIGSGKLRSLDKV